jgi:hypothetical protein
MLAPLPSMHRKLGTGSHTGSGISSARTVHKPTVRCTRIFLARQRVHALLCLRFLARFGVLELMVASNHLLYYYRRADNLAQRVMMMSMVK